jgi:hypothetical protein
MQGFCSLAEHLHDLVVAFYQSCLQCVAVMCALSINIRAPVKQYLHYLVVAFVGSYDDECFDQKITRAFESLVQQRLDSLVRTVCPYSSGRNYH